MSRLDELLGQSFENLTLEEKQNIVLELRKRKHANASDVEKPQRVRKTTGRTKKEKEPSEFEKLVKNAASKGLAKDDLLGDIL